MFQLSSAFVVERYGLNSFFIWNLVSLDVLFFFFFLCDAIYLQSSTSSHIIHLLNIKNYQKSFYNSITLLIWQ